jgi:hypothetical protein
MKKICPKCGKEYPMAIIFNTTALAISFYFTWQEDWRKKMCWDCYCKMMRKTVKA